MTYQFDPILGTGRDGKVTLAEQQLGFNSGTAEQQAAFQSSVSGYKKPRIVSALGGWRPMLTALSNGTSQVSGTDKLPFSVFADATALQFLYVGGSCGTTGLIGSPGNSITFRASVDRVSQQVTIPFASGTAADISGSTMPGVILPDSSVMLSEPLPLAFLQGDQHYVRTYKVVAAGEKWPTTMIFPDTVLSRTTDAIGGGAVTTGADTTTVTGASMGAPAAGKYAFGPTAIIGVMPKPIKVAMVNGDSIANGYAVTKGYIRKALEESGSFGVHTDACDGATMLNYNRYDQVWGVLAPYADLCALHMGTNDLQNASITTLAAYQTELRKYLVRVASCSSLWVATILPRTSSTDVWATVTNQGVLSWESLRIEINNWLRTSAMAWAAALGLPLRGVIENCVGFEVNSDGSPMALVSGAQVAGTGGRWPVGATTDGIHPGNVGSASLALLVPVAAMLASC